MASLIQDVDPRGVARLSLNRTAQRNAFDEGLIAEITGCLHDLAARPDIRALVLTGNGGSFCAGADLDWMRRMADYGDAENEADAARLAGLMHLLDRFPRPTIARVMGSAFGGGVGLAACCDIVVAGESARFCLSEVRLGLTPATISPYVIQAIGARQARRYFTTAEVFNAAQAQALGLVHEAVPDDAVDATVERLVSHLLQGAPGAQADAKQLVFLCEAHATDDDLRRETGRRIARRRASAEGREGVGAFLTKTKPGWQRN